MFDPILEIINNTVDPTPSSDSLIRSMQYAPFELENDFIPYNARLAIVLIEKRLLNAVPSPTPQQELLPRLERHKYDLLAEGINSRFIIAEVYKGPIEQDGKTVLMLRRMLQFIRTVYPNLEGITLVGNFPETALVRRYPWAHEIGLTDKIGGVSKPHKYCFTICSEFIDTRSDIVLSDLTGNWDAIYHESINVEDILAWPDTRLERIKWHNGHYINTNRLTSTEFEVKSTNYKDVFFINDSTYNIVTQRNDQRPYLEVNLQLNINSPELSNIDRGKPNPIAMPDISVGRINPYHVAVDPNQFFADASDNNYFDSSGKPKSVKWKNGTPLNENDPYAISNYFNPILERRMINDYFDRNHKFRTGQYAHLGFRAGAIATKDFSAAGGANFLSPAFQSHPQTPVIIENATLPQYARFLKQPIVLRSIHVHSDGVNSQFSNNYSVAEMNQICGNVPYRWVRKADRIVPEYASAGAMVDANVFIHRTLWEYGMYAGAGQSITLHAGCSVNASSGGTMSYTDASYAKHQNAEGQLFFGNCVALLCRAKVFFDDLDGFSASIGIEQNNVGKAFKDFYNHCSQDAAVANNYPDCKRSYNWSIVGDWSLRLFNIPIFGLFEFDTYAFVGKRLITKGSYTREWFWQKNTNFVRAVADVNGDGIDELIICSPYSMGIFRYDGKNLKLLENVPNNTYAGSWLFNTNNDTVLASGNFTTSNIIPQVGQFFLRMTRPEISIFTEHSEEILVKGSQGLAVLGGLMYNQLQCRIKIPNGGWIGGWHLNAETDRFEGFGKITNKENTEAVVLSQWGMAILSFQNNNTPFIAPNQSLLGNWRLTTYGDKIAAVADMDGDTKDEIIIKKSNCLNVLKYNTVLEATFPDFEFQPLYEYINENGSDHRPHRLKIDRTSILTGKFSNTNKNDIILLDDSGLHLIQLRVQGLVNVATIAKNSNIGGHTLNILALDIFSIGDIDGDGLDEFVLKLNHSWIICTWQNQLTLDIKKILSNFEELAGLSSLFATGRFITKDKSCIFVG